jgi:hypothetical protein
VRVVPSLSVSCNVIPGADCERSATANVCLPIGVALALVSAVTGANMFLYYLMQVGGDHNTLALLWL